MAICTGGYQVDPYYPTLSLLTLNVNASAVNEPDGTLLYVTLNLIGSGYLATSNVIPVTSQTGSIGDGGSTAKGEIPTKVPPGGRVLVPGPNGLMQSATVRQLLSGYYELEVGSSGETIWVPISGVVPE